MLARFHFVFLSLDIASGYVSSDRPCDVWRVLYVSDRFSAFDKHHVKTLLVLPNVEFPFSRLHSGDIIGVELINDLFVSKIFFL